jgi:branched-chain amino acid transport system permease protein
MDIKNKNRLVKKIPPKLIVLLIITALLIIAPFIFWNNDYVLNILVVCVIWAIIAESWNLIMGYADVFSFAHVAFWVIGAYTTAMLTKFFGWNPWLGMIAGGLVSTLVGVIIALPCLRLKGIYVGLVTFAIQLVLPTLIIIGSRLDLPNEATTGGSFGLARIPSPALFGYNFNPYDIIPWYFVALFLFAVFMALIYAIVHSKIGMAFVALRDSGAFAKALGVNQYKYKVIVFAISAFISGTVGAFYVHYLTSISTESLSLEAFLLALVMVIMGGIGRYPGGAVGAFVITIVNELLRPTLTYRLVIMGIIVIVVMTYMPTGLMGMIDVIKKYALRYYHKVFAEGKESTSKIETTN